MNDLAKERIAVGILVLLVFLVSFVGIYFLQNVMSTWADAPNEVQYTVQSGDTIYTVGIRFGVPWQSIATRNNILSPFAIRPGEILIIPVSDPNCASLSSRSSSAMPLVVNVTYQSQGQKTDSPPRYVMLRFDDNYQDQWVYALPIIANYGFRAVFATVAGLVLKIPVCGISSSWEKMNWQQIQWLYANGNEISDHTMTHAYLNNLTSSQLKYQILDSRLLFESYGINYTPALTLPFGKGVDNSTVTSYIFNVGFKHIYPDEQTNYTGITNYTAIRTGWYSIDELDNQSLSRFQTIAQLSSSSFAVGFIFHHIDDHVTDTRYYVNATNFAQDMQYLYENGYTVILPENLPGY